MLLENKVAIITGGSRGIGKAIAVSFVKEGAKVVIASRTLREILATCGELQNMGGDIRGFVTDISIGGEVDRLVQEAIVSFGTVDILVNCAGIQSPIGSFLDTNKDEWLQNILINLVGTTMCCRSVLPGMIKNKKGKIINLSGGGATSPRSNFSAYACSKSAIVRFTETLAMEVKDYGIDVNAIAPGIVNTRMMEEIINAGDSAGQEEVAIAVKVRREGGSPPELAAELAVFLASINSDGLSGKLISAVWDKWKEFNKNIDEINASAIYTIRRVDGRNFIEKG